MIKVSKCDKRNSNSSNSTQGNYVYVPEEITKSKGLFFTRTGGNRNDEKEFVN